MARKRMRYTLDVHFTAAEEKEAFIHRLRHVRELYSPEGGPTVDNCTLMTTLFDAASKEDDVPVLEIGTEPTVRSFLQNSGKFVK